MDIYIGVENFGKIEKARINISNYTLLVGQNNSGKTYMMQLIFGVCDFFNDLSNNNNDSIWQMFLVKNGIFQVNKKNVGMLIDYINKRLEKNRQEIIIKTFKKEIEVDRIYVDMVMEENECYEMEVSSEYSEKGLILPNEFEYSDDKLSLMKKHGQKKLYNIVMYQKNITKEFLWARLGLVDENITDNEMNKEAFFVMINSFFIQKKSLFLPASRTGLMLLYKEFFANKTDEYMAFSSNKNIDATTQPHELTKPVYMFLRFLQTWKKNESNKNWKEEISFFENKLIEGQILVDNNGSVSYHNIQSNLTVPIYLASSMVNDVAPILWAISGHQSYGMLFIDEAEASLHPQKQLELARFFNRLVNNGMSLIVSTHSDTFTSKINNLYCLSNMRRDDNKDLLLKKFQLEEEDLISAQKLSVYQFENKENGRSIVKELIPNEKVGFDFELFKDTFTKLYDEAKGISELNEK